MSTIESQPEVTLSLLDGHGDRHEVTFDPDTGELYSGERGGTTIADLADDPMWDLRVAGQQLTLDYEVVTDPDALPLLGSTLKVPGFEVGVKGQWLTGDKVTLQITVEVDEVKFVPIRAKKGSAAFGIERVHQALKPHAPQNA